MEAFMPKKGRAKLTCASEPAVSQLTSKTTSRAIRYTREQLMNLKHMNTQPPFGIDDLECAVRKSGVEIVEFKTPDGRTCYEVIDHGAAASTASAATSDPIPNAESGAAASSPMTAAATSDVDDSSLFGLAEKLIYEFRHTTAKAQADQMALHEAMLQTCLPMIYGADWPAQRVELMRKQAHHTDLSLAQYDDLSLAHMFKYWTPLSHTQRLADSLSSPPPPLPPPPPLEHTANTPAANADGPEQYDTDWNGISEAIDQALRSSPGA